jgi:serine/alanine adding enzyme
MTMASPTLASAETPTGLCVSSLEVRVCTGATLDERLHNLPRDLALADHPAFHPAWPGVLREALNHEVFLLEAQSGHETRGVLLLALVQSALFGRFLVSLPYLNVAGIRSTADEVTRLLVDRAVELADEHNVRYLELRTEREISHPALTQKNDTKIFMRLALPATADQLWNGFKSKLRSQIRAGEKQAFQVSWGRHELLTEFYAVFSRNMRDLGTPVFPRELFASILTRLSDAAELCVVRVGSQPVAAALLTHGQSITEVPSASSLRSFNSTNANMVMYWHLLRQTIERGQQVFDFGRSTIDSSTYRFKRQWGAEPSPSVWQYYLRHGTIGDLRPDNSKFGLAIRAWKQLPLCVANLLGPHIIRGIP